MKFLYLWPFFLLILIAVIILMYILKQKAVDHPFSSLFLWKETYRNMEANTPWEKLKKNWLMILQIITLILLILALTSPYLLKGGTGSENVVIVLDNSGGMNMLQSNSKSRLEDAKAQAEEYVQKQRSGTKFTLLTSAQDATLLVSNSDDKAEVIRRIKEIEPTVLAGNCTPAVQMIESMQSQWSGSEVVYFTDTYVSLGNTNGYIVSLYQSTDNMAIEYLGHGYNNDKLMILAKIANYSANEQTADVNLYSNDELLDINTVTVLPYESKVVYFEDVVCDSDVVYAELTIQDALEEDNICYDVLTEQEENQVLLMTQSNLYLEKALTLVDDVTVTKSNDIESFNEFASGEYDLYIFDGMVPTQLPSSGNMIFINCNCPDVFTVKEKLSGVLVKTEERNITKYLEDYEFGVGECYSMEVPSWAQSFLKCDNDSVAFIGMKGTQTVCTIGFDFHNTDLPLKVEFPLMIYNIMSECVSSGMLSKNVINPGNIIQIGGKLDGSNPTVTFPDGKETELSDIVVNFSDTKELGVYRIKQQQSNGDTKEAIMAVNFPYSESKVSEVPGNQSDAKADVVKSSIDTILELRDFVIILALLLLGVEWIFFLRR